MKPVKTIDFSMIKGWDDMHKNVQMTTSRLEQKDTFKTSKVADFGKMTAWKPIVLKSSRVTDDNYLLDNLTKNEFKSAKYHRVSGIDFSK